MTSATAHQSKANPQQLEAVLATEGSVPIVAGLAVVPAKREFVQQTGLASGIKYRIVRSADAAKRHYRVLL